LWWILGGTIAVLAIALYVPVARNFFQFGWLSPLKVVISVTAGAFTVLWFEVLKILTQRKKAAGLNEGSGSGEFD
jgi:Ca2+-transporting ATPase